MDQVNPTYEWILFESELPVLKLDINFPQKDIHEELLKLKEKTVTQIGNENWLGCTLRGISSDKPRPYYEYGYTNEDDVPYNWTDEAEICPQTIEFINNLLGDSKLYRIKVNVLQPGGRIHLHNDSRTKGLGVSDKSSDKETTYIALAVYWPRDVIFNLGNIRIPIETGDAYLIDFSLQHEVYNPTNEDRYYLVITGKFHQSEKWRNIVLNSYLKNKELYLPAKIELKTADNGEKYTGG
jgi:hypothetical protein